MNENLQLEAPTFNEWLQSATTLLREANIPSAKLDAELILAHTIRKPRTYLHAHGDEMLDERRKGIADARIELRINRTPIAYIVGHKEFYGRRFTTTPAALIPRPETEAIIDLLKEIIPDNLSFLPQPLQVIDIGTGTGCIGITVKKEWPECHVTLTDTSNHALNLARDNATRLVADVQFIKADLLHGIPGPIDILIANLPYVDREWEVSLDAQAEPEEALYADDEGLALINKLIIQASTVLKSGAHMLLESDARQHESIIKTAEKNGFKHQRTEGLITWFTRV